MTRVRVSYQGNEPDFHVIRSQMRDLDGVAGRVVDQKSRAVLREARRLAPVRSGRLLATIRREGGVGPHGPWFDVIAGARGLTPYLGYVLFGTDPHIIRARRRKALRFISRSGAVVFRRQVSHPGTRARPFLQRALLAAKT